MVVICLMTLVSGYSASTRAVAFEPRPLDVVMRDMAGLFTDLAGIAQQPVLDQNAANIGVQKAQALRQYILEAYYAVPKKLAGMPPADLGKSVARFQRVILQLATESATLELAFRSVDLSGVQASLKALAKIRSDGHTEFK